MKDKRVIVRGGGDIASGSIYKLYQAGFQVLVLETSRPSAIRRNVSFSEAVYQGKQTIEGVTCILANDVREAEQLMEQGELALLVDPIGSAIESIQPMAVIDAILAKHNTGTHRHMAGITIGLGPGFEAGMDVDAVIETMRGHSLGRVLYEGRAIANTGIPGEIKGYSKERVIYSPCSGTVRTAKQILDEVAAEEIIAFVEAERAIFPVRTRISGVLRGILPDGYEVPTGFKMADVDPRTEEKEFFMCISDKARCIAGGVLEAVLHLMHS